MQVPDDFYTINTLFSLSGSATAVWIITSVIGYLLESDYSEKLKRWIGLLLSISLSLLGTTLVKEQSPLILVVAVVNGFLIYLTAVGANTVVSRVASSGRADHPFIKETGERVRGNFTEPWW